MGFTMLCSCIEVFVIERLAYQPFSDRRRPKYGRQGVAVSAPETGGEAPNGMAVCPGSCGRNEGFAVIARMHVSRLHRRGTDRCG
jgi:hypothetical protein